jgi:hypothetical protein
MEKDVKGIAVPSFFSLAIYLFSNLKIGGFTLPACKSQFLTHNCDLRHKADFGFSDLS